MPTGAGWTQIADEDEFENEKKMREAYCRKKVKGEWKEEQSEEELCFSCVKDGEEFDFEDIDLDEWYRRHGQAAAEDGDDEGVSPKGPLPKLSPSRKSSPGDHKPDMSEMIKDFKAEIESLKDEEIDDTKYNLEQIRLLHILFAQIEEISEDDTSHGVEYIMSKIRALKESVNDGIQKIRSLKRPAEEFEDAADAQRVRRSPKQDVPWKKGDLVYITVQGKRHEGYITTTDPELEEPLVVYYHEDGDSMEQSADVLKNLKFIEPRQGSKGGRTKRNKILRRKKKSKKSWFSFF
jgi:hypothetical protein